MHEKVFKIVADQAANVKKAFSKSIEVDDVINQTKNMISRQRKIDLNIENEKIKLAKEEEARADLEKSIQEMNQMSPVQSPPKINNKRKAFQIIEDDDLDYEDTEELDKSNSDIEENDATFEDADSKLDSESEDDFNVENKLAYLPCAAHNIQLVLKD